jgi:hypothetical protein
MISDCLGLDITKDRILEITCFITDGKLTKRIEVDIETKYFCYFGCCVQCYDLQVII